MIVVPNWLISVVEAYYGIRRNLIILNPRLQKYWKLESTAVLLILLFLFSLHPFIRAVFYWTNIHHHFQKAQLTHDERIIILYSCMFLEMDVCKCVIPIETSTIQVVPNTQQQMICKWKLVSAVVRAPTFAIQLMKESASSIDTCQTLPISNIFILHKNELA